MKDHNYNQRVMITSSQFLAHIPTITVLPLYNTV